MKIQLTEYKTGRPILLDSTMIAGIRELEAIVDERRNQIETVRTRIDTKYGDLVLVSEGTIDIGRRINWIPKRRKGTSSKGR